MKQKDIALIAIVVFMSAVFSYVISNKIITAPSSNQQVQVVAPISSNFNAPSSTYFNSQSIDPTQLIQIGNNSNNNPFGNGPQN
jgi:hypothetical protein